MIIDSHVHIFNRVCGRAGNCSTRSGKWGAVKHGRDELIQVLPPYIEKTQFKLTSLLRYMEYEEIDRAVLLQGSFYGNHNRLVAKAIKDYPDKFAGSMYIEPWRKDARNYFEKNIGHFNTLKIEASVPTGFSGYKEDFRLTDYMWLYEEMAVRKKTLVLDLGEAGTCSYQTEEVKRIIDRCGDIRIVICHLAQPRAHYLDNEKLMKEWGDQIGLSLYGNVAFDTASLNAYFSSEIYPYDTGLFFFKKAIEIAGTRRIMTGTDMPGNSLIASYRQMLDLPRIYGEKIGLGGQEIADIMGNNAERFYFIDRK